MSPCTPTVGAHFQPRAYGERNFWLGQGLKVEPVFVRLHSGPRFQDLLRCMNYPEAS